MVALNAYEEWGIELAEINVFLLHTDYSQQMLARSWRLPSGQLPWKRSKVFDVFSFSIFLRLSYRINEQSSVAAQNKNPI